MSELDYDNIFQEFRSFVYPGRLKLRATEVMFKNEKTGRLDHFSGTDIEKAQWLLRARGHCLRLLLSNGVIHRYEGFPESELDKLTKFFMKNYDVEITKKELAYKGWNWGNTVFEGNAMDFVVGTNPAFEVPLTNVSNASTSKNEVVLEFHQNDDAEICLMEMRFHIPGTENNEPQVEEFYDNVMKKADIIEVTGDSLVEFKELHCLQPRGRYDIKMYPTFIHLHGKTFDYKISMSTILRMFLLPHKKQNQTFFVVNIDPPVKHGQTRYHFIIMLFDKDAETTAELKGTPEELQERYEGKLEKEMSGLEYEVIARIFKVLVQRKITVPGNFGSDSGDCAVPCFYKAFNGFLYPLERGFIYVFRPAVHVRFDEISQVQFSRGSGAQRTFDFEIETRNGTSYTFNSIEKDQYHKLYDFVTEKKLRVKNIDADDQQNVQDLNEWSSSDESHDAYMEKMKKEGRRWRPAAAESGAGGGGDDDTDDEDDEDFKPPESGSEVAEEYDSNVSTSTSNSDSDSASDAPKKKKAKKDKREHKKKRSGGGGGGGKKKADKDSNAPKRPTSAYMLWLNTNRPEVKEKAGGDSASVVDVAKMAGEIWKTMSDDEKAVYQKEYVLAKEKYEEAMKEYRESGAASAFQEKTKKNATTTSPRKSTGGTAGAGVTFKSDQFVESSGGSSSDSGDSSAQDSDEEVTKNKSDKQDSSSEEEAETKEEQESGSD